MSKLRRQANSSSTRGGVCALPLPPDLLDTQRIGLNAYRRSEMGGEIAQRLAIPAVNALECGNGRPTDRQSLKYLGRRTVTWRQAVSKDAAVRTSFARRADAASIQAADSVI